MIRTHLAFRKSTRVYSDQLKQAIKTSLPPTHTLLKRHTSKSKQLVTTALKGIISENANQQNINPDSFDGYVVHCSFKAYAHAVAQVLEELPHLHCKLPYPQIWTIFKKPIPYWYNTFPIKLHTNDAQPIGYVTYKWWEDYKNTFVKCNQLKTDKCFFKIHRLIVSIDCNNEPPDKSFLLYDPNPLPINEAITLAEKYNQSVEWHSSIMNILKNQSSMQNHDALIYLIGKPKKCNLNHNKSPLINHFISRIGGNDDPCERLRLLKTPNVNLDSLNQYEDLFIIRLTEKQGFGVGYLRDINSDIAGAKILSYSKITEDPLYESLYQKMTQIWNDTNQAISPNQLLE